MNETNQIEKQKDYKKKKTKMQVFYDTTHNPWV